MIVFIFALLCGNLFPIEACIPENMMGTLIDTLQSINVTNGSISGPFPGPPGGPFPGPEGGPFPGPTSGPFFNISETGPTIEPGFTTNPSPTGVTSHGQETSDPDAGLFDCEHVPFVGDGACDDGNNHENCAYDGGDCCGDMVVETFCQECLCKDPSFQTPDTTTEANPSTVVSGNFTTVSEDPITTFNETSTIVGGNSTIDEPTTTVESFDYL